MEIVRILSTNQIAECELSNGSYNVINVYSFNGEESGGSGNSILSPSQVEVISFVPQGTTVSAGTFKVNSGKIILGEFEEDSLLIKILCGEHTGYYTSIDNVIIVEGGTSFNGDVVVVEGIPIVNDGSYIKVGQEVLLVTDEIKELISAFNKDFLDKNITRLLRTVKRSTKYQKMTFGLGLNKYSHTEDIVVLPNGDKVHSSESFIVISGNKVGIESNPERYGYVKDYLTKEYILLSLSSKLIIEGGVTVSTANTDLEGILFSTCMNTFILNKEIAELAGWSYCEECSDWEPRGYHKPELASYHNGGGRENLIGDEIFGIGFEVEKEDKSIRDVTNHSLLRKRTGWVAETDSSLDSQSGFELVSPALPFNTSISIYDQLDWINQYIKPVEKHLNSNFSDRCGG